MICKPGWTKTIRPPASYTNQLKQQQIAAYGYSDTNPRHYEEDHPHLAGTRWRAE